MYTMMRKKKKKLKDPNKPKQPMSSFFLFMEDFKKTLKEKHPSNNTSVITASKEAGEKWKSMSEAEKAPYISKAKELMAEFKKNMQAYNNGGMKSWPDQEEVQDIYDDTDSEEEEKEEEIIPPSPKKRKSPPPSGVGEKPTTAVIRRCAPGEVRPSTPTKKACAEGPTHELDQLAAESFLKFKEAIIKDYLGSKEFDELKTECAGKAIQEYKNSEEYQKALTGHKFEISNNKELAELLQRYKKSEVYRKSLAEHLDMHKKSEEYKKELAKHLEMHKKSEKYKKELAEHLERHKKSDKYKKELADEVEKYKASKEHKNVAVQEVVGSFIQGLPDAHRRIYDLLRNRFPELDIGSCSLFPAESSSEGSKIGEEIKFLLLLLPFLLPVVFRPNEDDKDDTLNLRDLISKKNKKMI